MVKKPNKKNIKKFLIFLSLLSSIITIYETAKTYAVFYSESLGILNKDIAKWQIVINDTDIVSETIESFEINKLNAENSESTNGKLAPGMEGSFEIVIEPKTTQVSVRYDIVIDTSNLLGTDIKLISVEETEEESAIIKTDIDTYTGIIPLSDITEGYLHNIKIVFCWEEDGENEEYVEVDESIDSNIQIPITVKATQYLGEEINAYID